MWPRGARIEDRVGKLWRPSCETLELHDGRSSSNAEQARKKKKKNKSKTSIQTLGEQGDPRTLGCLQPMLAPRTRGRTRNSIDESRQAELLVSDLSGIWNVLRLAECKHERRNRYRGQFGKGVDKRRGIVLGLTSILAEGSLFTCERRARTPKQTPSDWVVPLVPRPS